MPEHPTDPAAAPDPGAGASPPGDPDSGDRAADPVVPEVEAVAEAAGVTDEPGVSEPVGATAGGTSEPADVKAARSARWARRRAKARRIATSRALWLGVAAALVTGGVVWHRCGIRGCPSVARLASYQPGGASVVLDRNGQPIGDLAPVKRQLIRLSRLPAHVPAAFIAVEDKRFHEHNGVDWRRVGGAALANVRAGRTVQGSSTITMQLARNVFPERIRASERTFTRKLLEVRVAREIERRFSKDEILEMYLNHIYFGAGAYGIEAASRQYFGKSAASLTLEQAALLAALPRAPTLYDPRQYVERARSRRDLVLALMLEQNRVTSEEAGRARGAPIRVRSASSAPSASPVTAPYFVAMVRAQLEDELGEDLYAERLRIHTTLDSDLQKATEQEMERQIRSIEGGAFGAFDGPSMSRHDPASTQTQYLQGAAVMMESATGDVLALVGGRNARHSTFNRAVAGQRQVGSAFKPFVFAAALQRGWSPSTVLDDSPFRLVSGRQTWEPSNFDGEFVGPITFRDALVHSRNVPTIRLVESVGEGHVAKLARDAGLRGEIHEAPVMALGVTATSPLDLATAYTAFAHHGEVVKPRLVLRVEAEDGRVLWSAAGESRRVMEPAIADIMTDMLADVVDRGTGRAIRSVGYQGRAAGKTGTTNDGADVWFVGYTPRMIGSLWIGFDQPRAIAPRATGGSVAAPAWGRIARRSGEWSRGDWQTSPQVIRLAIDPSTGFALEPGCRPREGAATEELFLRGREPRSSCPARVRGDSRSWLDRAITWVGDLFGDAAQDGDTGGRARGDRADGDAADDGEQRFYRERYGNEDGVRRRSDDGRRDRDWRDDEWRSDEWRGRAADRAEWVDDLVGRITERFPSTRQHEETLAEWVEGVLGAIEDARADAQQHLRDHDGTEWWRRSAEGAPFADSEAWQDQLEELERQAERERELAREALEEARRELLRALQRQAGRRIADAR